MAELEREGDELVVKLSTAEKAEAVHGDIRVPMSAVRRVEAIDDVQHAIHGFKSVGTAWPGRFYIGTFHGDGGKTFAAVHHDKSRGVLVTLEGANFDQVIISCDDPESVVDGLGTGGTSGTSDDKAAWDRLWPGPSDPG